MVPVPYMNHEGAMTREFDLLFPSGANIDIIVNGFSAIPPPGSEERVSSISMHTGGGGALCALGVAKLGLRPALWGIIGDDPLGKFLEDELAGAGVTTFLSHDPEARTGVSIAFNPETDRSFLTYDGSCTDFSIGKLDSSLLERTKHVHLTGYRGQVNHDDVLGIVEKARAAGCTVSLDIGWDDTGEWHDRIFEVIDRVDLFFCNRIEALNYTRKADTGEALKVLASLGAMSVIKLASEGAIALERGRVVSSPAFPVKVVDTTGAGDSFNAGFLFGWLSRLSTADCLCLGNACGGLSVTKAGGNSAFPRASELSGFLESSGRVAPGGALLRRLSRGLADDLAGGLASGRAEGGPDSRADDDSGAAVAGFREERNER